MSSGLEIARWCGLLFPDVFEGRIRLQDDPASYRLHNGCSGVGEQLIRVIGIQPVLAVVGLLFIDLKVEPKLVVFNPHLAGTRRRLLLPKNDRIASSTVLSESPVPGTTMTGVSLSRLYSSSRKASNSKGRTNSPLCCSRWLACLFSLCSLRLFFKTDQRILQLACGNVGGIAPVSHALRHGEIGYDRPPVPVIRPEQRKH